MKLCKTVVWILGLILAHLICRNLDLKPIPLVGLEDELYRLGGTLAMLVAGYVIYILWKGNEG